jgi:ScaI restriction endonuclease
MSEVISPYQDLPVESWLEKTKELVQSHPLSSVEIVEIVLKSWNDIFVSTLGSRKHHIGKDIFPPPQVLGFLLQEFVALTLKEKYPEVWRGEVSKIDKDLAYIPNNDYSIEIKSSSQRGIYGNRSYAQKANTTKPKKSKSGYYLAINFEGFKISKEPKIKKIRFGWLDAEDWRGQLSATGQQSNLSKTVEIVQTHYALPWFRTKLLETCLVVL